MRPLLMLATFVGLLIAATTADAATSRSFDIRTTPVESDGAARAFGTVSLQGRRVRFGGRLDDICPADGAWARVSVSPYSGKTRLETSSVSLVEDLRGCEAGPMAFYRTYRVLGRRPITIIRVTVTTVSGDQGQYIEDSANRKLRFR